MLVPETGIQTSTDQRPDRTGMTSAYINGVLAGQRTSGCGPMSETPRGANRWLQSARVRPLREIHSEAEPSRTG